MGDGAAPERVEDDPEFKKLREQYLQAKFYEFQPILNAIEDANWGKPVTIKINDTKWVFRKLTHAEMTLLTAEPYFHKLLSGTALDEKEQRMWASTKRSMVTALSDTPEKWSEFIEKEPSWVEVVFSSLLQHSAVNVPALDKFFETDYGYNYGFVWFVLMHRTPTEVGRLSEGDYQAVSSFFRKNAEKLGLAKK